MNISYSIDPVLPGVLAALTLSVGVAHAATLTVPSSYATIQDAVDAAVDGDQVVVADGTYLEDIDIFGKDITLRSASGDPSLCVVEGGIIGLVIFGPDCDVTVRGMTFRDSSRGIEINSDARAIIENCVIEDCTGIGGMFVNGLSLRMSDCIIRNNASVNAGGGMLITSGDAVIERTVFRGNDVTGFNAYGGGLHCGGNITLLLTDCRFRLNTAVGTGGGFDPTGRGGGFYVNGGTSETICIANCLFDENESNDKGGGLYIGYSNVDLSNVEITENIAERGGGLWLDSEGAAYSTVNIANAVVAKNQATNGSGGGLRAFKDAIMNVTNATIWGNTATDDSGGVANGPGCIATFTNCIVGNNLASDFAGAGTTTVTYSNVESGFVGVGNISEGPDFVDAAACDFRLTLDSPGIDAGNTAKYCGPPTDLDGNHRGVDEPDVANTGLALSTGAIDMGAYEYQPVPVVCLGDLNGDGEVGPPDLAALLSAWGLCP